MSCSIGRRSGHCPAACALRLVGRGTCNSVLMAVLLRRDAQARRLRLGFGPFSRARVCLSGRGSKTRTPTCDCSSSECGSPCENAQRDKYEVESAQQGRTGTQPDQAESAALMRALAAPMSVRPAAFAFTIAITLPMSFTDAAPVDAMASLIRASTSASASCAGR